MFRLPVYIFFDMIMILAGICIYIVLGHRQLFEVCTGHRYKSYFSVMQVQYYTGDRYNIYTGCRYDIFMMQVKGLQMPRQKKKSLVSEAYVIRTRPQQARGAASFGAIGFFVRRGLRVHDLSS